MSKDDKSHPSEDKLLGGGEITAVGQHPNGEVDANGLETEPNCQRNHPNFSSSEPDVKEILIDPCAQNQRTASNTHGVNTIQILVGKNKDSCDILKKKDLFKSKSIFSCFKISKNTSSLTKSKSELPSSPLIDGKKVFMTTKSKNRSEVNSEWKSIRSHTNSLKTSKCSPLRCCFMLILYTSLIFSSLLCGVMWFTDFYNIQIQKRLTLYNGSVLMQSWSNSSVKPLVCVYAFNYTNADEFLVNSDDRLRLKVQEVGPYCYRETLQRLNTIFNDEDGTLTFSEFRSHTFDEEHSKGNKDDVLTLPNVPFIGAASLIQDYYSLYRRTIALALRFADYTQPFIQVKAHDYFFGYDDSLVKIASKVAKLLHKEGDEKFGILAKRSGLSKDRITIQGGYNDLDHIGEVIAINGLNQTDKWKTEECNVVEGSYGTFFSRKAVKDKSKPLYVYNKDLCRKIPLEYKGETDFQDGMMADTYSFPKNIFGSPKRNNYNSCFCKRDAEIACPDGIFDATACSNGFPMIISQPHFLNADPILVDAVDGLSPNETKHDFKLHIHRGLGITVGSESRIQINIRVTKVPEITALNSFEDESVLPIVWLEVRTGKIPAKLFEFIHHASITVHYVELLLKYGSLFLVITILLYLCYSTFNKFMPWSTRLKLKRSQVEISQNINMVSASPPPAYTIKNKF